ncbi:hypothetical protein ACHAXA_011055 [Cyclostephanos tholiformis]|uniref:Uncharacterized protein n=1 Tax=Cyclostephanos tholiformis TaxID=382380 RepID=A0ABD3RZ13_9STRA
MPPKNYYNNDDDNDYNDDDDCFNDDVDDDDDDKDYEDELANAACIEDDANIPARHALQSYAKDQLKKRDIKCDDTKDANGILQSDLYANGEHALQSYAKDELKKRDIKCDDTKDANGILQSDLFANGEHALQSYAKDQLKKQDIKCDDTKDANGMLQSDLYVNGKHIFQSYAKDQLKKRDIKCDDMKDANGILQSNLFANGEHALQSYAKDELKKRDIKCDDTKDANGMLQTAMYAKDRDDEVEEGKGHRRQEDDERPRPLLDATCVERHAIDYGFSREVTPPVAVFITTASIVFFVSSDTSHGIVRHSTRIGGVPMHLECAVRAHLWRRLLLTCTSSLTAGGRVPPKNADDTPTVFATRNVSAFDIISMTASAAAVVAPGSDEHRSQHPIGEVGPTQHRTKQSTIVAQLSIGIARTVPSSHFAYQYYLTGVVVCGRYLDHVRFVLGLAISLGSVGPLYGLFLDWPFRGRRPTPCGCARAILAILGIVILCLWGT